MTAAKYNYQQEQAPLDDAAGTTAYVTNQADNTVSVISTATSTVTGLATGFSAPRGITIARQ